MITNNQYSQFRDYLVQINYVSSQQNEIPTIGPTIIADKLDVSPSYISRFMRGKVLTAKKALDQFIRYYPLEFQQWPRYAATIQRMVNERDLFYFLGISQTPFMAESVTPHLHSRFFNQLQPLQQNSYQPMGNYPVVYQPQTSNLAPFAIVQSRELSHGSHSKFQPDCGITTFAPMSPNDAIPIPFDGSKKPELGNSQWTLLGNSQWAHHTSTDHYPTTEPIHLNQHKPVSPQPLIAISYRGNQNDKEGKGLLFDHMRVQAITHMPTAVLLPENRSESATAERIVREAFKNHPATLPYGEIDDEIGRPHFCTNSHRMGLLIIPGQKRQATTDVLHLSHEYKVIRSALNRGQPIIGLCAGSWRLWEQLLIWTRGPDALSAPAEHLMCWHETQKTLIDLKDHNYNGGMARLDKKSGEKVLFNVQIHNIEIKTETILKKCFHRENGEISVNSVHWKAVNPAMCPENIQISATAKNNPHSKMRNRRGELMSPTEQSVEAFESIRGALIIGVQWHLEAYDSDSSHGQLLQYMALAGKAYQAKRAMVEELNAFFRS